MIIENNGRKIIIGKNIPDAENAPRIDRVECDDPEEILYNIVKTIEEGGYNPVSQLVGYVISEDPTHISNYKNARTLMNKIDRDELLEHMVKTYIDSLEEKFGEDTDSTNELD